MEIIFVLIILSLAFFGMSIGVILKNKPLQGSCGGLSQEGECSICGGDPDKCDEKDNS
jgi:hypothetical protein|tara:strand:+ start:224 stop:397 length:174 start_codon:yes stop_codon:yes gene_type:complete